MSVISATWRARLASSIWIVSSCNEAQRAFSAVNDLSHLNKRACEVAELDYLLLPLPYEIQQQLKDGDEMR